MAVTVLQPFWFTKVHDAYIRDRVRKISERYKMGNGTEVTIPENGQEFRGADGIMNIYEKILAMRLEFHQSEVKKSGYNSFAKYSYFELGDFVLPILRLCDKYRVFTRVSFKKDEATLEVVNMEQLEQRVYFTSPMGKAELKGTHEIQQIGAVQTYERRYLYVLFMDIVEHDAVDSSEPPPELPLTTQAANAMTSCMDVESLKKVFANFYRQADDKQKLVIKADYDDIKAAMEGGSDVLGQ